MRRIMALSVMISGLLVLPAFAQAPEDWPPEGVMGDWPTSPRPLESAEYAPFSKPLGTISLNQNVFHLQEKAAYLGVTTSPVADTLREQLGLPKGFGLVVDSVEKDSPADKAGLKVHDVLQKLDDQLLINAPQLTVLVRSKKADDEITFTVIRAAKPMEIKAKLVEKALSILDVATPHVPLRLTLPGPHARLLDGNAVPNTANVTTVLSHADDTHRITLTTTNGKKTLIVEDAKTGKLLHTGPANSEDDLKTLSPDIREKLKAMVR